jgi:hypothetical protein
MKNKYNEYINKKYKIYNKNNIKNIIQEGGSKIKSNFENINFYNNKIYENNFLLCLINN